MSALPSGTVTFLMTDVVGSTALWAESGDAMERALACLSADIERCVRRQGGTIIRARGEGDSHFAVFDRASRAARAAIDLQRERLPVPWPAVRVAVHTAEADPRDGDYLGAMVNRTARIRATAHGRQIVCSRVVADLLGDVDDVEVRSLGVHRVRDIPTPVELYQIGGDGLPTTFPPLETRDHAMTAVMTFVVVDQVGSTERVARAPGGLLEWQGRLYRTLRVAADARDGRFFKFLGDGCLVAFEDPRAAVGFADDLSGAGLDLRVAVTTGLAHIIEGELSGLALWEAFARLREAEGVGVWTSPVVDAIVGDRPGQA